MQFQLESKFKPTGDQPQAIEQLSAGVIAGAPHQTLLGVTGSGKTFTIANVIQKTQKPTLVIAHNKTLAAQLYQEFRDFFPHNAVNYFVSYYDYYQPEAYIPSTDTYIEKDSSINDEIDKLRLAATTNLLTRPDVIVIASVSCIYNLGSPVEYGKFILQLVEGEIIDRETLMLRLLDLQYERSETELKRGSFRLRGDTLQLWPAYEDVALRIDTLENKITTINWIDPVSGAVTVPTHGPASQEQSGEKGSRRYVIYPAKHYVVNPTSQTEAFAAIEAELQNQVDTFKQAGKLIEAYRIEQKVKYDLEMIKEFGFVGGIENYSRFFDGRQPGQPPFSLLEYMEENAKLFGDGKFLTIIDESHITVPQIGGMHNGDRARKETLIQYGFRLPSALDNRPLRYDEFASITPQTIYVSATPKEFEVGLSQGKVTEQLVRPTGLIDPEIELRPIDDQIEDLVIEVLIRKLRGQRSLVTTLTKRMAETLTDYLNDEQKIKTLVKRFNAKSKELDTEIESNTNPDQAINGQQFLDPDALSIGKVPDYLYSRASKSHTIDATNIPFPKVAYLHSDIDTLERSDILDDLRRGVYDVLVGINLLREGLDLPEVTLVAILDADKEGFLRSKTSMIQTMGRSARHSDGHVILYADRMTGSMIGAISETYRRRAIQVAYNQEHGITPTTISKPIRDRMIEKTEDDDDDSNNQYKTKSSKAPWSIKDATSTTTLKKPLIVQLNKKEALDINNLDPEAYTPAQKKELIKKLSRPMTKAADGLDFELAAIIRDAIKKLTSTTEE